MSNILVKKDSKLVKEAIIQPISKLSNKEKEEVGDESVDSNVSQTRVDGVQVPLIKLNNITIQSGFIQKFKLSCRYIPIVELQISNSDDLLKTLQNPDNENRMIVQIIPSFDNGYKKINLSFYCYEVMNYGTTYYIKGIYNIPGLHEFKLKSFGKSTTYDCFDQITDELNIGFASNIDNTTDERYIYSPSKSYKELIEREIKFASYNDNVIDCWIDYWDTLNIVNIQELYTNIQILDPIFVTKINIDTTTNSEDPETIKIKPIITNDKNKQNLQLYIEEYNSISSGASSFVDGTDRLIEYFNLNLLDTDTFLVEDGSKKNDIFTKYDYFGEYTGDYDYIKQMLMNDKFIKIVNDNYIEVELNSPCFGLMRGQKCELQWFEIDSDKTKLLEDNNDNIQTNINITEQEDDKEYNEGELTKQVLNKQISGQYLIIDSFFTYDTNKGLRHILRLSRSNYEKQNYIKEQ